MHSVYVNVSVCVRGERGNLLQANWSFTQLAENILACCFAACCFAASKCKLLHFSPKIKMNIKTLKATVIFSFLCKISVSVAVLPQLL